MAKHLGLKVKFVSYFGDDVHGKLLPRERRILINARQPRTEHIFTLLHETGHFVVHHLHLRPDHCPRFLRKNWKNEFMQDVFSKARRYVRLVFNGHAGREWEADLWAMCAFVALARQLGCRADLLKFLDRHPEKLNTYRLVAAVVAATNAKTRLAKFSKRLARPFKTA